MSATGLEQFDHAVHAANVWLKDILTELNWTERHDAYRALRAVLHALRDHLPIDEAVQLSAQLPLLIRGLYFESWHPADKPIRGHNAEEFLRYVSRELPDEISFDLARITKCVLQVVARHTTTVDSVKHCLRQDIRALWN